MLTSTGNLKRRTYAQVALEDTHISKFYLGTLIKFLKPLRWNVTDVHNRFHTSIYQTIYNIAQFVHSVKDIVTTANNLLNSPNTCFIKKNVISRRMRFYCQN